MSRCVGGTLAVLCFLTSTAFGDIIVNGTFGSSGPAYWNNPSTDGTGCYNIGCVVSGQYGTSQSLNTSSLMWATNNPSGLSDFYFQGLGAGYTMKVLMNATANIIAFGIYDLSTPNVKIPLYVGDGSGIPTQAGSQYFAHTGNYGFYADVTYSCAPGACPPNLAESYRSQSSTNTHTFTLASLATAQHFAVFQISNGYVIGVEDGLFWNGLNPIEGNGDFQDFAVQFTQGVPEPGTIALFSLGAVGLLALKRRRKV